jgi:hypothetical protein
MEIGIFIPRGSQFDNEIPDGHQRKNSVFWSFLQPVLGLQPEHLPWDNDGISREIATIRAYEARRLDANNAVPFKPTFGEVVSEVVSTVAEAVKAKVRKPTELQRAKAWLQTTLEAGPMEQREVEKLARKEGITDRTLKRAKQALRVKSTGKPRQPWIWSLLRVRAKGDSGPGE